MSAPPPLRIGTLSFVLAAAASAAPAQTALPPAFVVDRWDTDDGLPQNTVNAIAQTRDGYLWVGTFGGLARFDGVRFTLFLSRQYPGIPSDRVHALAVDSTGVLWIGTERGLSRYDGGGFTAFRQADGLPDDAIEVLRADSRGALWIGTSRGGLARLHEGAFRTFSTAEGVPPAAVNGLWEDESGSLFANVGQWGVRVDLATLAVTPGPGILPAPHLHRPMLREPDGAVWYNDGQALYLLRDGVLTRYGREAGLPILPQNIARDSAGNYWVGPPGLAKLQTGPPAYARRYPLPDGRLDYNLRTIFIDREGTRWAGTETDGLLRLRPRLFTVLTRADGFDTDLPLAMLRDRTGRIWIGTNCGQTAIIEHGRIGRYPPAIGCIWALAEGPDGAIWMSPFGGGLYRVRGDAVRHYTAADGLSDPLILAIHVDRAGVVWAGTGAGLNRLHEGRITVFDTAAGLPQNNVHMIVEDRAGALWVGTLGGLARLYQGDMSAYTAADGLIGDNVRSLHEDAEGVYWIGTYGGGLNRLKDGRFTNINSTHGLFDDVVSAILEDDRGNLWMAGNRGIFRANRRDLNAFADGAARTVHSVGYGKGDGLLSPETNGGFQPGALKTPDGRLWFPTIKGLAIVNPAEAAENPVAPGVVVEDVLVDGRPEPWVHGLRVPAEAGRRFEIRYTGLSSPAPEAVTFRYRMSGVDDDWVFAKHERVAYYSRLPHGRYRFTVDAANRDGVWNGAGAGFDLIVLPPFWMTWWFRALAAGMVLGAVGAGFRLRLARTRAAQAAQREFSRRLIATQEEERKRIAAELHDSVGQDLLVVKNRAVMALERPQDPDAMREQLHQIADVITGAIKDTRAIAHNLRPYQLDRVGLGASIRAAVVRAAAGSGIRFTVQADDVDHLLPPEAEIAVFRIIQEGVNNILKHSRASEATVSAFQSEEEVRILIVDNGRGADLARPGFGLSGITERVSLLGGRHELESEPGRGTTLRIAIPTGRRG